MTSAAVYLRISQDATGEALGVTRQREDCLALADGLGWEVVEVYTDNDISATTGKSRPAYRKMLTDIDAGRIEAIIAWHADRLYRKAVDLGELVDVCKRNNTQIATVRAGTIDLTTPTGRLVAGLLAQVATYEGEAKADRWKRSWRQGREAGRFPKTGSRMFGYTRTGELIPEEAGIARGMAADIISGVPILTVSRRLESQGITTTRDGVWRPGTIRQYLANPVIAGLSTLNGEIVGEGAWEPVLDRDTWETVRALLKSRSRPVGVRVAILNGLIFCGKCGHRLVTGQSRGKRIYRCPDRPGLPGCGGVGGNAEPIEEIVEAFAQARLSDPRVVRRIQELRATAGTGELLAEIAALEARLVELEAELDVPGVPVSRINRAIDRTEERLAAAQKQLADATTASAPVLDSRGAEWPADLTQRRNLVAIALGNERVYLDGSKGGNRFDPRRVRISRPL